MKCEVYNQEGKEIGQTLLPKEIFDVKFNPDLVHQVVVSQMANRRKVIAHTKTRGEVSGGGRKPWRQKGTGRARHGSIRSPLWRKGGVTFGPTKERVFKKKINKKMKRLALFMVLSVKVKNNRLIVLDKISLEQPPKDPALNLKAGPTGQVKTKWMAKILKNLPIEGSILIALPKVEKNLILAARNLPKVATIEARNLNAFDLLSFKYLIMPKDTIKVIQNTFGKPKSERGRENPSVSPESENIKNRGF